LDEKPELTDLMRSNEEVMADIRIVVASAHLPLRRALASYLRSLPGVTSVTAVDNSHTLVEVLATITPYLLLVDADLYPDWRGMQADNWVCQLRAATAPAQLVVLVNTPAQQRIYCTAGAHKALLKDDLSLELVELLKPKT
jgi:DNA-binding NarL/FixJ family response regulator